MKRLVSLHDINQDTDIEALAEVVFQELAQSDAASARASVVDTPENDVDRSPSGDPHGEDSE
jgi:proline racemase